MMSRHKWQWLFGMALGLLGAGAALWLYIPTRLGDSYLARYLWWNQSEVDDKDKFLNRPIANAPPVFQFKPSSARLQTIRYQGKDVALDPLLSSSQTTAFIVIQNDAILYENYFNGYGRDSINTSFSTAKSFASALIGIALDEGYIQSVDEPIVKYLPALKGRGLDAMTIKHLLTMSTGIHFSHFEFLGAHFDMPWHDNPRTYYDPNLRQLALSVQPSDEPIGAAFRYNNYHPLLIGMILERATHQPVAAYLQEKMWKPLGMEYPASWSIDSAQDGFEKMESGINARAIDFAKFGRLFLNKGNWNGKQLISEKWVSESTSYDPNDAREWLSMQEVKAHGGYYKYMWWGLSRQTGDYMAAGKYGQYIFISPRRNLVLVRYGFDESGVEWGSVFTAIAEQLGGDNHPVSHN